MNSKSKNLQIMWCLFWIACAAFTFLLWDPSYKLEYSLIPALSKNHFWGADSFGRNALLLTLRGSFISLAFSFIVVILTILIGFLYAMLLFIFPNRIFQFFSKWILDFSLSLPFLILALSIAALRGSSWSTLLFALLVGTSPLFCRLIATRSEELAQEPYVHASLAIGTKPFLIFKKHFIPALVSLGSVKVPNLFAHALIGESTLSFLGVGAPIGADTWGSLLHEGHYYLLEAPHIAIIAGVPLFLTLYSLQQLSQHD